MRFIADFHIHSKYARATSIDMDLEHLDYWAKVKGINVLGTGDFTHPLWFKELKEKLEEKKEGLFLLKNNKKETYFILTSEVSCVYSKKGKTRKIHLIIFAPSFEVVEKINTRLGWIGNLSADGRPTLGIDAKELTKIILDISDKCLIVPAHCWTPWFSLFGSKSGFDSIEECFEEYSQYIYAGETGLSANPLMFWRVPDGRKITLISNSDSHSPSKIGREANVFEGEELSYQDIIGAIKNGNLYRKFKSSLRLDYTIEFFPEEGKYHYDGHRLCGVSLSPKETKKYNGICPVCHKPLTIGVLYRVEELADKEEGFRPENAIPFKSLVPLEEIISEALNVRTKTKEVEKEYFHLIEKFGSEFNVLLDVPIEEIKEETQKEIAEGIRRVREGDILVVPGYDGVFGKIKIFEKEEIKNSPFQKTLF